MGVTLVLLLAVLAGCTAADRTGTTPATSGGSGAPSAPTPTPGTLPATPAPSGPGPTTATATATATATRIVLTRSGGFAGRGDTVTVEPDGRWTAVDRAGSRRTGRLDPADLGRLHGLAADPRLAEEARRSPTPTGCADVFSYRLTVGAVETEYVDCPADAPPPPATRALVELLLRATG
ncbi:hypothetical protein ACFOW4_12820 [Micromonospora sp. GCM10011542]|uniref:hypothetical protein n=1 Tax=Micromonospora sp. GCM10011542 TaxID=3317337 RepID=UPI00361EFDAC